MAGLLLAAATACSEDASLVVPQSDAALTVHALFPAAGQKAPTWSDCINASPLSIESQGQRSVLVAAGSQLTAIDPKTGAVHWEVDLPSPEGQRAWIVATPVVVGSKLVVAFQRIPADSRTRLSHHAVVVDLDKRALDPDFPELEIQAHKQDPEGNDVAFSPANAVSRAALVHASVPDRELGLVYVSFGNPRDIQPWHGWVFELDLDRWRSEGTASAISAVLLTTPQSDCGPVGSSGVRETICGAGVWSPAGPKLYPTDDGYELFVPTGNGALDLARHDYAHTVMRVGRGLKFDPHCDMQTCADFEPSDPAMTCMQSCRDLFIPRVPLDTEPLVLEDGICDGKTLFECYARQDWDLGANSPAKLKLPSGRSVLVQPAKDGALYLFDAEHMGTLYDRVQVAPPCGTQTDACSAGWAGMIVAEPLTLEIDGAPMVLVPTFMFDHTHPAGIAALRIDEDEHGPWLTRVWQAPNPTEPAATKLFRRHASRLAAMELDGHTYVFEVSVVRSGHGLLFGARADDGAVAAGIELHGRGRRFIKPLVIDHRIYVPSCADETGPSQLEGFELGAPSGG